MPNSRATLDGGQLVELEQCYIDIPRTGRITFNNLPDISDQKSASYTDEAVIGRASPMKTYSHSDNRSISIQLHFLVTKPSDAPTNLQKLRWLESAVYPRQGYSGQGPPFVPPPVCKIKCGPLLASQPLCAVLKSYSVKYPTDVAWDDQYFTPYKFDVDTTWDVVYRSEYLPGQNRVAFLGY